MDDENNYYETPESDGGLLRAVSESADRDSRRYPSRFYDNEAV